MCVACGKVNEYPKVGWPECSCGMRGRGGHRGFSAIDAIDWIICGGESGQHARPMWPAWARSLRDQCAAAGVPFLFKQWGEWGARSGGVLIGNDGKPCPTYGPVLCTIKDTNHLHTFMSKVGKNEAGRILDGVEHNGFPEVSNSAMSDGGQAL